MNTLDAITKRVSTRAYRPDPLSEETLDTILRAGCAAPVAMGAYDGLHLTVVQNEAILKDIFERSAELLAPILGAKKDMDFGARTLVFVSSLPGRVPGMEYANAGCILENMAIAATDLGIASVIVGAAAVAVANDPALCEALQIPAGFKPLLGIQLGCAAEEQPPRAHRIAVTRV